MSFNTFQHRHPNLWDLLTFADHRLSRDCRHVFRTEQPSSDLSSRLSRAYSQPAYRAEPRFITRSQRGNRRRAPGVTNTGRRRTTLARDTLSLDRLRIPAVRQAASNDADRLTPASRWTRRSDVLMRRRLHTDTARAASARKGGSMPRSAPPPDRPGEQKQDGAATNERYADTKGDRPT